MGEALDPQGTHQLFSSKIGGLRSPYLREFSLDQKSQRSGKQQMTSVSPGCGHTRDCSYCQTRLNPGPSLSCLLSTLPSMLWLW
ncbi:hypothetical protein AB205_0014340 [Aquarana catesbeiana]|uniref:Uncharacterized protein n=1 Tax=Aquarana catesbeiana TaxID=8400 RepID=A0A2G9Q9D4_AQUCT|nr:hypothetical protein AB205_0014340 [Aquarana catesbeiana]